MHHYCFYLVNNENHQVKGIGTELSLLKRSSELLVMHRNGVYRFLTNFMNLVYRIYNSETNINRLNDLFQTFRTLLNSDGSVAVDRSSNTVGNLFGIYYAIVTGIEHAIARHKDKKEKKDGISEKHDEDLERNGEDDNFSRFSCHTKGHILMSDNKYIIYKTLINYQNYLHFKCFKPIIQESYNFIL